MIIDKRLQVSTDQAFTATAASTDVIDLGVARDIGRGRTMWMVGVCKVAMGGTSPTLTLTIETDDNSSRSSAAVIASSKQYTALALGDTIVVPLPPGAYERYLGAKATMGGTSPTVTLDIFFTDQDPTGWKAYADAL